ncbi:MAG TPA: hypothetical protein VGI67_09540, partial [Thermoleophilaceae bacterium]
PLWRLVGQLEDGLQGGETAISDAAWSEYLEDSPTPEGFDVIVAHGPGPLAAAAKSPARAVWRYELDASNAEAAAWERLEPLVAQCDAVAELPAAIDPLAPGSIDLPVRLAGSMLRSLGVDLERPCVFQARPFDSWQDPHHVLDAFALARESAPGLQLVLAGDPVQDDVEAWRLLREVSEYAEAQQDLQLLRDVGDVELNALRAVARAGVESTLAPASQVTKLETLWKGTPMVSARSEDPPEATAGRIAELVNDPGLAVDVGRAGHELVRRDHLITRLAENELRLLASFQST